MARHGRRTLAAVVLAAALAVSAVAVPPPPNNEPVVPEPIAPPPPPPAPQPQRICHVTFDAQTTRRWAHVQGGWRGGDGDFSVALPGKRTLWLFGDSIVSRPDHDGFLFVRNSAVIEEADGSLMTTAATAAGRNSVGFDDPPDERWLWPGAGFVVGSQLWLFESEMRKSGDGYWGFQYVRSWLFRMDLRGRRLVEVTRKPLPADGVIWGAALIPRNRWLYVFGVQDDETAKHPRLARVAASNPVGSWTYWDGATWTDRVTAHAGWHGSVASEFSVVRNGSGFGFVTAGGGLSATLDVYDSRAMTGPWTRFGAIYKLRAPGGTFAYNPLLHRLRGGDYLLSYNVAPLDPDHAGPPTPAGTRPRFAHVERGCI